MGTGGCKERAFLTKNWRQYLKSEKYYKYTQAYRGADAVPMGQLYAKQQWVYYTSAGNFYIGKTKIGSDKYFFGSYGERLTGLQQSGSTYNYFGSDGRMLKAQTVKISGWKVKLTKGGVAKLVKPAKTTAKSLVSTAKNTIKFKTQRVKEITGYEIQYSRKKNFKGSTTQSKLFKKGTDKGKTRSLKIKDLKSKKTYYARVRTYKVYGAYTLYSKWTTVLKIKVK
jgi:hypothetical protein